jgi:hypothetical protein
LIRGLVKDEVMWQQKTLAEQAGPAFSTSSQVTKTEHTRMMNLLNQYAQDTLGFLDLIRGISNNLFYRITLVIHLRC